MRLHRHAAIVVLLIAGSVTGTGAGPASATGCDTVDPGFNLFTTTMGTDLGLHYRELPGGDVAFHQAVVNRRAVRLPVVVGSGMIPREAKSLGKGDPALLRFEGVPISGFDFGDGNGAVSVGSVDTIVERLDGGAAPSSSIRVVVRALQLATTNLPGYFVTLQSMRTAADQDELVDGYPDGSLPVRLTAPQPSGGLMDVDFNAANTGGDMVSRINVNFDVRQGSLTGPIVYSGSTDVITADTVWGHADPGRVLGHLGVRAQHIVSSAGSPAIDGVNNELNGLDDCADFHAGAPV